MFQPTDKTKLLLVSFELKLELFQSKEERLKVDGSLELELLSITVGQQDISLTGSQGLQDNVAL